MESLEERSLSAVRDVLSGYCLGEGFLEKIGYEVRWKSFAEEDAEVVRK